MAKIGFALILFFIALRAYPQQDGLVLIDADDHQPFFVRLGEKIYHSSPVGHLTIANLKDGNYLIDLGFPQNRLPEQRYNIKVNRKDQGFLLKLEDGKGMILYNWQTQETSLPLHADTAAGSRVLTRGVKMDDAFSRLMAAVVNDSLVMYNTYIEEVQAIDSPKTDTPSSFTDTANDSSKNQSLSIAPESAENKALKEKAGKGAKLLPAALLDQHSSSAGMQLVYISYTKKGVADTVTLDIPYEATAPASGQIKPEGTANAVAESGRSPGDSLAIIAAEKKKLPVSNCKKMATDQDIDALRVKMLDEYLEDHRIDAARKFLKSKCISVKQTRALAELFSSDKSRYQFYEAAYPFVSDQGNFGQLSGSFVDKTYKDQFNTKF